MVNYIFIGGTYRGFKVLESLLNLGDNCHYCYIMQEDDHEVQKFSSEIIELAKKNNISYSLRQKLIQNDYEYIKNNSFDFAVVCGWRTIIDTSIIKYFKFGAIAAHDSLLPEYRGFAPMNWAMINGEKETGVTLFLINNGEIDSGDIISKASVLIKDKDYAIDVYYKITEATIKLYLDFFKNFKSKTLNIYKQDESRDTYTCKRIPSDGKLKWEESSKKNINIIRALAHPYPGAFCYYKNEIYYIRKAELGKNNNKKFVGCIPGRVIYLNDQGIEVLCGSGTIFIREWENKDKELIECPSQTVKYLSDTLL